MSRWATVDIGSNTLLLLIAEQQGQELVAICDQCRFSRLGKGVDSSGVLAADSVSRSIEIIEEYRELIEKHSVDRVAAVGTQALREAQNSADFVSPAEELLGTRIEIIAGEREAALVYRSVAEAFPVLASGDLVVADVGGGSTEIICGREGQVSSLVSVPIGAVRMSERHLKSDPATSEQGRNLIDDIDKHLAGLDLPSGATLVATAGTATTLASVEQKLLTYEADKVQGFRVTRAMVERQLARYLEMTTSEKRRLRGLEPQRADVIAGGAAIYARLACRLEVESLITSDRGVRWGLAYELASASSG